MFHSYEHEKTQLPRGGFKVFGCHSAAVKYYLLINTGKYTHHHYRTVSVSGWLKKYKASRSWSVVEDSGA